MGSESVDKAYATQIANIEKNSGNNVAAWVRVRDGFREAMTSWRWWPGYASWMLVLLIDAW